MILMLPDISHSEKYEDMMEEWLGHRGRIHPGALRNNGAPYERWLKWMRDDQSPDTCPEGSPPQTLYFCFVGEELVGAVTVRHCLNEKTAVDGGHIGLGIRPGSRMRGYGVQALVLAAEKARERGISKMLLTCDEDNIGSQKTMLKQGAVYFDTVSSPEEKRIKRFWLE
jgi:predicted acetyltransferase